VPLSRDAHRRGASPLLRGVGQRVTQCQSSGIGTIPDHFFGRLEQFGTARGAGWAWRARPAAMRH
jgi:hypothetical protein